MKTEIQEQQSEQFETSNSEWTTETLKLTPIPFSINFTWQEERITVQLENGEDVLKLAQIFSDFLKSNNIPNKVQRNISK